MAGPAGEDPVHSGHGYPRNSERERGSTMDEELVIEPLSDIVDQRNNLWAVKPQWTYSPAMCEAERRRGQEDT